jgi:hypothetical protein
MAAETSTDHYLPKDKDSDSDSASVASDTPFDQRNHSLCHMEVVQSTFPARLIDVGDEDEQVRLCRIERDVEIDKVAYAALSHSWGPSGIKGITTKSNLDSRLRNLPIKTLSKTFQDAITATRRLGLRYLWIDCFCIVQDDTHDWQVESTRMGSIYANCTVNFVAAAAHGGVDGCFFDRTAWFSQRFKLFVRERADRDEKTSFICQPLGPEQPFRPENCVTSGRSWCFQETLLAPRSIYFFKDELAWECRTTSASETFPLYRPRIRIFQGTRAPKVLRSDTPLSLKSNWSHFSNWMILVTQYSEGKLTFSKDKLIAISGVARAFLEHYKSQRFGPVDCGYFAGLWRRNLEFQLLWYATQPRQRELALRAPSWSWASVDRPIWYYDSLYHLGPRHPYHINIIDLDVNCCSSDLFGEVDGGYLKLSCKQLHPVVVEDFISSNSKWTLRWLSGTCHTDPRCTFVHLDSLPIILGLAIALPVLTTVRGSEYGLLLRILRPANDANVFYRCGYYEYNPFQEIEDWQRVLRVPDEEERIIVIV